MVKSCIVAELIRQNVEPVEGRAVLCRGEGGGGLCIVQLEWMWKQLLFICMAGNSREVEESSPECTGRGVH